MKRNKILVVDHDAVFREALIRQLRFYEEFDLTECATSSDAVARVGSAYWDAILLDTDLPDMEGRETCRRIRSRGVQSPIIMLSASSADVDTIRGLNSGANDYVTKPFHPGVLLARLRAQIRWHEQSGNARFEIGPYVFVPSIKALFETEANKWIRLTAKESTILKTLCQAGEHAVNRDVLLNQIWGFKANVTTHTLQAHIYRLRQKLERDPSNAKFLVTDPDGYRIEFDAADSSETDDDAWESAQFTAI